MASNENISHAEIWDDSLLVDSWNDALAEYEKYHSIHARGQKVEDVVNAAKAEDGEISNEHTVYDAGQAHNDLYDDQHAKRNKPAETADHHIPSPQKDAPASTIKSGSSQNQTSDGTAPPAGPAIPAHLIGQVHDDGLRNLLMAWYYAGYYTGLYEGQQGIVSPHAKHAKH